MKLYTCLKAIVFAALFMVVAEAHAEDCIQVANKNLEICREYQNGGNWGKGSGGVNLRTNVYPQKLIVKVRREFRNGGTWGQGSGDWFFFRGNVTAERKDQAFGILSRQYRNGGAWQVGSGVWNFKQSNGKILQFPEDSKDIAVIQQILFRMYGDQLQEAGQNPSLSRRDAHQHNE